jgi:hypothetical protein
MLNERDRWKIVVWSAFRDRVLTPADRDVLLTLAGYAGTGTAWPSHATLAERTRRHARTVRRALWTARGIGLVDWQEGGRWLEGGRWRRRSNRYRLITPSSPVVRADRPLRGQFARRLITSVLRKEAPRSVAEQLAALGYGREQQAAQDAMEKVRAARLAAIHRTKGALVCSS